MGAIWQCMVGSGDIRTTSSLKGVLAVGFVTKDYVTFNPISLFLGRLLSQPVLYAKSANLRFDPSYSRRTCTRTQLDEYQKFWVSDPVKYTNRSTQRSTPAPGKKDCQTTPLVPVQLRRCVAGNQLGRLRSTWLGGAPVKAC